MKFRIVAVGKPRDRALAAAITEYETRAGRYWPLEAVEVRDENGRDSALVRAREGTRLLEQVGGARLVICDEHGEGYDSAAFAAWLQAAREAARDVAFVIGGAFGLDDSVRRVAERRLALAPWTLPHELARVVLAEQLYRAGTIVRREPYHKA
ncbi:MAG: 23S rRNA (pseudouridine(1915)-N(3))-methyltransferase RlmH [Gemmatimonadaceae bacterium]|nr:23S rRNA (pseudouridine(1915)-N(3))-methyltransferase RlmH [Gemmatimonadaceae bacterium]